MPLTIFLSHSTHDDALVTALRQALEPYGVSVWADSQRLSGGDDLTVQIQQAISAAQHVMVLLSPRAINAPWVYKEVQWAQAVQRTRHDGYKVIPLLYDGVTAGALLWLFGAEVAAIALGSGPNAVAAALPALFAALGLERPVEPVVPTALETAPLAELTLYLSEPAIVERDGTQRATARAELRYQPPHGAPALHSAAYRVTAPLGPLEAGELAWYLERYAMWPSEPFQRRAHEVETALPRWGQALYALLHSAASSAAPLAAWQALPTTQARSQRRVSVLVDERPMEGADEAAQRQARQAATQWLALPWELLHDGEGYLFQGARGVRVRRQLPGRTARAPLATQPPLRVLLISPRPEDARAAYLDHRVSAQPVVEALNALGELASYTLLNPPTFGAMQEALQRANDQREPYHVVHFDGHGVYDRQLGLGSLCFEDPADAGQLTGRRSQLVHADALASVLRDHRVPLVFLEACQTAHAEETPTASVAARLLQQGVASVVAMSHSVLVETARRFVSRFYHELLRGARIGEAMLAGQRDLQQDPARGKVLQHELRLQDWFVPVLLQEEADPVLLSAVPDARLRAVLAQQQQAAMGGLPPLPAHRFVGRSRELLAAERLLCAPTHPQPAGSATSGPARYVVLRGEGGEGKTALAVELVRWLVHSRRFARAAFVSLEEHRDVEAVRFRLGEQLLPDYVAQGGHDPATGEQLLARVLRQEAVLLVFDNMESVLPPPADDALAVGSADVAAFEPEVLAKILALAQRLNALGETRLLFTSREALPESFTRQHIPLDRLERADAIALVGQVLAEQPDLGPRAGQAEEDEQAIADLVDAVGCHARSLVLLAQEVGRAGVREATQRLHALMATLHRRYPNDRQRSLLASVELSLRRLPAEVRAKLGPLGAFHEGGTGWAIAQALGLDYQQDEEITLGRQLAAVGLGTLLPVGQGMTYLRLNPALAPALWGDLPETQRYTARAAWAEAMRQLVHFLYEQKYKDPHLAARLTLLELPNLLAALAWQVQAAQAGPETAPPDTLQASAAAPTWEAVVDMTTRLEGLLQPLGRPQALARVARLQAQAAAHLGTWGHARFEAARAAVERLRNAGELAAAVTAAGTLLQQAHSAGPEAYAGATYDLAMAHFTRGRMLQASGDAEAALPVLAQARTGFTALAEAGNTAAARMASVCLTESGDCLRALGRLEPAATAYEEAIALAEQRHDLRDVATNKGQLGTVRLLQGDYPAALAAWTEFRETFAQLNEPASVAVAWHQSGRVHQEARKYEAAEQAYQASLRIEVQLSNTAGQASTVDQLGLLYRAMGRLEDAVRFHLQAAEMRAALPDLAGEGRSRNNAAIGLITLRHYDAARRELQRAITCKAPFGHTATPWTTFAILSHLERAVGDTAAAMAARQQALDAYLAYRRAGGEIQSNRAKLYTLVAQARSPEQRAAAATQLTALAQEPDLPDYAPPVLAALQALLAGARDPALAADPRLDFGDAAELRLLLDQLGPAHEEDTTWQALNQRRIALIQQQYTATLSPEEASELAQLEERADQQLAPLDQRVLDHVTQLHRQVQRLINPAPR